MPQKENHQRLNQSLICASDAITGLVRSGNGTVRNLTGHWSILPLERRKFGAIFLGV
jgi:hypothetical protein